MKAFKKKQYLVFEFDDGKNVKYNLSNGETIGKNGKPVKDICTQLRNYDILSVINSFEDKNYSEFLKFIDKNFINRSYDCRGYYSDFRVNRIRNLGSFLNRIDKHSYFEQFFACGIRSIDPTISYRLSDIPSGLIKFCKEFNLYLSNALIAHYKLNPNDFHNFLYVEFNTINKQNDIIPLLINESSWTTRDFYILVNDYNYDKVALLKYIDNLMTYEAIDRFNDLIRELKDYAAMMNKLSNKFEKYPKNFLTTHKIAARNYNRLKEQFIEDDFQKRIDKSLEYSYGNYKIIYPESTQKIKEEAVCNQNCLASYIKKVIDGQCHILFLREKDHLEKSLVTLEIRDNSVVQAKGKFNCDPNKQEQEIIDRYNKRLYKKSEVLEDVI